MQPDSESFHQHPSAFEPPRYVQTQQQAEERLERLQFELTSRGWRAELERRPGHRRALHVTNPARPGLQEDVVVSEGLYRTAGGEAIAPVGDSVSAATRVQRRLDGPQGGARS